MREAGRDTTATILTSLASKAQFTLISAPKLLKAKKADLNL